MVLATLADSAPPPLRARSPVILIVEDEAIILLSMADYMRTCGYTVIEARHAGEAIDVLDADIHIDVLFSDVRMPGEMDGIGLARWVRRHRPEIAILLTSGIVRQQTKADDLCDDGVLLVKPYDTRDTERRLRRILEARDDALLHHETPRGAS